MTNRGRRGGHAALVPTALQYRQSLAKLHDRIFASLGADTASILDEAAAALALLVEDDLLAETEFELAVVGDYALYDVRHDGRSAVERYRDQRRPASRSKEGLLLAGMVAAHCSAFVVETVEPEVGFAVRDALGGPRRFVIVPGLAAIASEGNAFVARLVEVDGVTIPTGPSLPLDETGLRDVRSELATLFPDRDLARRGDLTPREAAIASAALWCAALASIDRTLDAAAAELLSELPPEGLDLLAGEAPRLWLPRDPTEQVVLNYAGLAPPVADQRPGVPPTLVGPSGAPLGRVTPPMMPIQRAAPPRGDHRDNVPRYRTIRQGLVRLQNELLQTLSKDDFNEAAASLGLLHQDVLVFDNEHEMAVVADHAIYDIRRGGRSAIERYLAANADKLSDEDRALLDAMVADRYTIVMIEGTEPGAGVAVTDLLGGPPFFLYDIGLGQGGTPGLVLATRLIAPDGLTMTTGGALPMAQAPAGDLESVVEAFSQAAFADWRNPPESERGVVIETIIRFALERAAEATILTNDPTDPSGAPQPPRAMTGDRGKGRFGRLARPGRPKKRRR
jgi:hypothetical protein